MSVLDWGPVSRIRRNHALEHATLQVLAKRNPTYRMAGYSDPKGFWMMGDVPTEEVADAVAEALLRLEGGESTLAIHPNCGTNFVAAGMLAGTLAWVAMLGSEGDWKRRLERWPILISLVTLGMILAQPLGPYLQARITTAAAPRGMRVAGIQREMRGEMPVHRVLTLD
jgi:hypothetical protein